MILGHLAGAKETPIVDDVPKLDPDVIQALKFWFGDRNQVRQKIDEWEKEWNEKQPEVLKWRRFWKDNLSDEYANTLGKLDTNTLRLLLKEIDYEDTGVGLQIAAGFPVAGPLSMFGHKDVTGSLLRKGKLAKGHILQLDNLWAQCAALNLRTLRRLRREGVPAEEEYDIVKKTWLKTLQEWKEGRVSSWMELDEVDMNAVLLTHRFGVWERKEHGWKVRCIDNYYSSRVNEFAWSPGKMFHDNLDDLLAAVAWISDNMPEALVELAASKTDFRSAFKTLVTSESQHWLQYLVLHHPKLGRPVVVKAFTHTFGSIGAGAAWWRVAQAIKAILRRKYKIPAFIYVDDVYILVPEMLSEQVLALVKLVITDMLGWDLDKDKSSAGKSNIVLGVQLLFEVEGMRISIPRSKRLLWLEELRQVLKNNYLTQSEAEKWSGRLQWASCHAFLRCARAALRPIIRRQQHRGSDLHLTPRLWQSIHWFISLLNSDFSRWVQYDQLPRRLHSGLIVYSDATGDGRCAAVASWPDGRIQYCRHKFPEKRKKRLNTRTNQVIAYELWAAALAILTFVIPSGLPAKIFIDNQAALQCLVRAYSQVDDLNNIAGGVLQRLSLTTNSVHFAYVRSECNLADGPSQNKLSLMRSLHAGEVEASVPDWEVDSLDWLPSFA